MKTKGLMVVDGHVMLETPDYTQSVPAQFWHRLKHAMTRAGVLEEFAAEYRLERHMVQTARASASGWSTRGEEWAREERLFQRWAERVCGPQTVWPWGPGWTEDLVDSYLTAPARRENAA